MQRGTLLTILSLPLLGAPPTSAGKRVAIIGGGISGTFAARYLAEYDANHLSSSEVRERRGCLLDEIVVYDVSPPPTGYLGDPNISENNEPAPPAKTLSSSDPRPPGWQGSRVSSVTLDDGSVVELGASIIYEGNQLVVDMMNGDPGNLRRGKPMGKDGAKGAERTGDVPAGFGIYHGRGEWLLNTAPLSRYPAFLQLVVNPLYILWRYNFDYFRLRRAVSQAIRSFDLIYGLLNDTQHEGTYFERPMDMWEAVGLGSLSRISFHDFLDGLGLCRDGSLELEGSSSIDEGIGWWDWRKYVPGMGCMRSELLTAMTLNTYNQDLDRMNGLVGLMSYVPAGGELFSVEGGNHQLMGSALHQAAKTYDDSVCNSSRKRVWWRQKKISTVVASEVSIELFTDQESLGRYDVVILAAPLQQCRIRFLVENPMGLDDLVLHDMPLGGIHQNPDSEGSPDAVTNEDGGRSFAPPLPKSATVPYTSVVTTLVSNATLNATHFNLEDDGPRPRSILMSERGKLLEGGLTTLTILSTELGVMKTFSSGEMDADMRAVLYGPHHVVEYVQAWGAGTVGKFGGATPDFGGGENSKSLPYLIYDGARHRSRGPEDGPALYYANAVESAVAAVEISAIGARSVTKLAARRLGLIGPGEDGSGRDEL